MIYERVKIFTDVDTLKAKARIFTALLIAISAILVYFFAKPFFGDSKDLQPYDYSCTFSTDNLRFELELPDEEKKFAPAMDGEIYFTEYLFEELSATILYKYDLRTKKKIEVFLGDKDTLAHFSKPKFFDDGERLILCEYRPDYPEKSKLILFGADGTPLHRYNEIEESNNCEFTVFNSGGMISVTEKHSLNVLMPNNSPLPALFLFNWNKNTFYPTYCTKTDSFYYTEKVFKSDPNGNLSLISKLYEIDFKLPVHSPVEIFSQSFNFTGLVLSSSKSYLLVLTDSDLMFKIDLKTRKSNRIFTKNKSTIRSAFCSPDGQYIFLARGAPDNDLIRINTWIVNNGEENTPEIVIPHFVGNDPVFRPI